MSKDLKIVFLDKKNRELYKTKWDSLIKETNSPFESTLTYLDSMKLVGLSNTSILALDKKGKLEGILPLLEEKFLFLKRYKTFGSIGKLDLKNILPIIRKKFGFFAVNIQVSAPTQKEDNNKMLSYHFILSLKDKTSEDIWKNDLNKKSRNMIRNAEKNGLKIKISTSEKELKKLYPIYKARMERFKTKPHSLEYMKFLLDTFPDFTILNIYMNNKIIAGGTVYIYKDQMFNQFAASHSDYLKYSPNNLLYWGMIKYATEKGCKSIDYGPSLIGDNVAKFKISMGGKPLLFEENLPLNRPLYWLFRKTHKLILKMRRIIS